MVDVGLGQMLLEVIASISRVIAAFLGAYMAYFFMSKHDLKMRRYDVQKKVDREITKYKKKTKKKFKKYKKQDKKQEHDIKKTDKKLKKYKKKR